MKLLNKYENGNYTVKIYDDGTKIRETKDDFFDAEFPDNIDVCITRKCSQNCPFCYEGCTHDGEHAELFDENDEPHWEWMKHLHSGTEMALNGNDLDHPQLEQFLKFLKRKGVIANITVNQKQFENNFDKLFEWTNNELIWGLGISLQHFTYDFNEMCKWFPNIVIHTIFGVTPIEEYMAMERRNYRVLILGYKNKNRGMDWINKRAHGEWFGNVKSEQFKDYIVKIANDDNLFKAVSFDNLALTQLDIKNLLFTDKDKEWEEMYQGDDGSHTFYIDLVEGKFAKDSTQTTLFDIGNKTLEQMMQYVKWLKDTSVEIDEKIYKRGRERFFGTFGKEYAENLLKNFTEQLVNNSKDLDPNFQQLVNENFWDLV